MKKRTPAEWRRLVAAYERGGESRRRFCEKHGLATSTLDYWRRRGRGDGSGRLVQVQTPTHPSQPMAHAPSPTPTRESKFLSEKLGDSTKFDFDAATGTFTSKASGAKYAKHPNGYAQGEPDSITHIIRGHTTNAFTDALSGQKSIFADATKVLDLIDEAMKLPASSRTSLGGGAFWVDLGKAVGTDINGVTTTKIRIVIRPGTTDVIHTAYPH